MNGGTRDGEVMGEVSKKGYKCNQGDQDVVYYCGITEVDIYVKIVRVILIHGIGV